MKQRKRGIRRMFAGAMAALMVLSAVDVSGWSVMNAKAEETTTALAKNMPECENGFCACDNVYTSRQSLPQTSMI